MVSSPQNVITFAPPQEPPFFSARRQSVRLENLGSASVQLLAVEVLADAKEFSVEACDGMCEIPRWLCAPTSPWCDNPSATELFVRHENLDFSPRDTATLQLLLDDGTHLDIALESFALPCQAPIPRLDIPDRDVCPEELMRISALRSIPGGYEQSAQIVRYQWRALIPNDVTWTSTTGPVTSMQPHQAGRHLFQLELENDCRAVGFAVAEVWVRLCE